MKLKWLGHSCFLLTSDGGTSILTDPYDPSIGYALPHQTATAVTVSHGHHDHNYLEAVTAERVFSAPGEYAVRDVKINAFPTWHDPEQGKKRGGNLLFLFELDGLRVLHCGDLGHPLSTETIRQLGRIDVLLLPVGGTYTITGPEAAALCKTLSPAVVVPMHYKTAHLALPISDEKPFLAALEGDAPDRRASDEAELRADALPSSPCALLLEVHTPKA